MKETWVDPYAERWVPYSEEEIKNLKLGVMRVPFDTVTRKRHLFTDFSGGKVFKSQTELGDWISSELDIPVWHRCAQIDFTRSTVIGYCPGNVANGFHFEIESVKFDSPANEVVVKIIEHAPTATAPDGSTTYSRPYEIIRILSCGNATVHFQVVQR